MTVNKLTHELCVAMSLTRNYSGEMSKTSFLLYPTLIQLSDEGYVSFASLNSPACDSQPLHIAVTVFVGHMSQFSQFLYISHFTVFTFHISQFHISHFTVSRFSFHISHFTISHFTFHISHFTFLISQFLISHFTVFTFHISQFSEGSVVPSTFLARCYVSAPSLG